MKLLVLTTATKPSRHLFDALQASGYTYDIKDPRHLYGVISESNGHDHLFDGNPELATPIRMMANEYSAIICNIGDSLNHSLASLRQLVYNMGIYTPHDPNGLLIAADKFFTAQVLSAARIKVPATAFSATPNHVEFFTNKLGGLPIVAKTLKGSQGTGVMIFDSVRSANTSLETLAKIKVGVKLQRYIEASGKDIRAIVVGNQVVNAMERSANKETEFRANLSRGGTGAKIELTNDEKEMCIKAAQALGLEFAGVDLIREKDGTTYCTEVNGNPGSKIIDLTKHNHYIDLLKHIDEKVRKSTSSKQSIAETKHDVSEAAYMSHSTKLAFTFLGIKP